MGSLHHHILTIGCFITAAAAPPTGAMSSSLVRLLWRNASHMWDVLRLGLRSLYLYLKLNQLAGNQVVKRSKSSRRQRVSGGRPGRPRTPPAPRRRLRRLRRRRRHRRRPQHRHPRPRRPAGPGGGRARERRWSWALAQAPAASVCRALLLSLPTSAWRRRLCTTRSDDQSKIFARCQLALKQILAKSFLCRLRNNSGRAFKDGTL